MEVDKKALSNCMILAAKCLSGERVTEAPQIMAELWADVAKVRAALADKPADPPEAQAEQ